MNGKNSSSVGESSVIDLLRLIFMLPSLHPNPARRPRQLPPYPCFAPVSLSTLVVCIHRSQANVEITSRYDGVVRKIHWDVGDMVQVGITLGH